MTDKNEIIFDNVKGLVSDFLYYDRKECEDLPLGDINKAIDDKDITIDDIVKVFERELTKCIEAERRRT